MHSTQNEFFSSPLRPQYYDFALEQKLPNAFSKVENYLLRTPPKTNFSLPPSLPNIPILHLNKNFRIRFPKFSTSENAFQIFCLKAKSEYWGAGGREKFTQNCDNTFLA
jgi:hypothetical protein